MQASTSQPLARIATLDVVRGVAVMGILLMNIVAFAMPLSAYDNPAAYGGSTGADLAAWAVMFVLVDGKMRGLFSVLFGASILLITDRADAKGENPVEIHFRRMGWLFGIGLIHLYLIWWGDILAHYALVGVIAIAFRNWRVWRLVLFGLLFITIELVMMTGVAADAYATYAQAHVPGASADDVANWVAFESSFGIAPPDIIANDLVIHRGDYGGLVAYRWGESRFGPLATLAYTGAATLGYMVLGMAGLKSGMLTGNWPTARYRRWARVGFGIGMPAGIALATIVATGGFDVRLVLLSAFCLSAIVRPVMIAGWAALIILLARPGGWLTERIAAAGRMALSNYLGTSLICATLFYGQGLGLYGTLGRAQLYPVVAAIWLLILFWSRLWLGRFAYGPVEWVWRSLARWKFQPMRIKHPIAT